MDYNLYLTGGAVRDQFLGFKPKDLDYTFVFSDITSFNSVDEAFQEMYRIIERKGSIFLSEPGMFTIRYKDGDTKEVKDVVLARKELYYPENGRRPVSTLGTLRDDLIRRDFTVNAMAKDEEGRIIDLFGGYEDLMRQSLNIPGDPWKSFKDDPLRIIRGMRFCITKNLVFSRDVRNAIREIGMKNIEVVSHERIREELTKCFRFDTVKTLKFLQYMEDDLNFPIISYIFEDTGIWLEPTNRKK